MVGAQDPFPAGRALPQQRTRGGGPPRLPVSGREVASRVQGAWIVGAKQPLTSGQGQLKQQGRLADPARILVGGGEIVLRDEGVGMVRAKQPLPADQSLLEQRNRLGGPARRLVGGGEAVSRVQRVWMIVTQRSVKVGDQRLADGDGLRRTVAELNQVIEREEPEPQQDSRELLISLSRGCGPASQRRHLLR